MVSAKNKFGTEDFQYNGIDDSEYNGGAAGGSLHAGGKQKRGGVGGKASKSHNFKENKNANKRRNEKFARENEKIEN